MTKEQVRLQADADAKTASLAEIDARKAQLFNAARMPVDGLDVVDHSRFCIRDLK